MSGGAIPADRYDEDGGAPSREASAFGVALMALLEDPRWAPERVQVLTVADQEPLASQLFPRHSIEVVPAASLLGAARPTLRSADVIVVPPWVRARNSPAEQATAHHDQIMGAILNIVPAATLKRQNLRFPTIGMGPGWIPELVAIGAPKLYGVHDSFVAAMIVSQWKERYSGPTRFVRRRLDHSRSRDGVAQALRVLQRLPAGVDREFGFVAQLSEDAESWWPADHDPGLVRRAAELGEFGSSTELKDLYEVLRPRIAASSELPASPVVLGRDVARGIVPTNLEPPERTTVQPVPLRAGDLVLAQYERSDRPFRPLLITEKDLPLAAARGTVVLRPRRNLPEIESRFHRAYLASRHSRELLRAPELSGAIYLSGLDTLPLPSPDRSLVEAFEELESAATQFRRIADESEVLASTMFDSVSAAESRSQILRMSRGVRQRLAATLRVDTLEYRVAEFYPFPIAYRWREVQTRLQEGSSRDAYAALLECFEVTLSYSAWVVLALAHEQGVRMTSSKSAFRKISTSNGGLTLGDWTNILKQASADKGIQSAAADSPLRLLSGLLPEVGSVAEAQVRLSRRRNDQAHLRGLDEQDLAGEVREALSDLETLLSACAVHSDFPLARVIDTSWDSLRRTGSATLQLMRGDHPIPESRKVQHSDPTLERGSLYLTSPDESLHLLRPFLTATSCTQCRKLSIYHPDRREKSRLYVKALDHGHSLALVDVERALEAIGAFGAPGAVEQDQA